MEQYWLEGGVRRSCSRSSTADRLAFELVSFERDALNMAIAHRGPPVTLHSDQGSTYATGSYREIVNRHGIRQSMSRKGDCWDNAPMESFFHTLKTELVMHCDYQTRNDARASLFAYMEVFYNRQRRHSSINYQAPLPFEAMKSPGKVSVVRG